MSLTLNELESSLAREMAAVRKNPGLYATYLERDRLPFYEGNALTLPDGSVLQTKEGDVACHDAIRFLQSQSAVPELKLAYGMILAAQDAVKEHGPAGTIRNLAPDGEELPLALGKLESFGKFDAEATEVNGFGGIDARGLTLSFLICDGDPTRSHRNTLFNTTFTHLGLGAGEHKSDYQIMANLVFTKNWKDK